MKVIIAEDEPAIAGILAANLKHAGFEPLHVEAGPDVLHCLEQEKPDVILLDVMLPGMNGYDVCQKIRAQSDIPIIMITAKVNEADRLKGFEIGADDYVCKPFSPREVIARINSLMKRVGKLKHSSGDDKDSRAKQQTSLVLCTQKLTASLMGQALSLTSSEFNILYLLAQQPDRVFERAQILDQLRRQGNHCNDRAVDSHIKNLRRKLREFAPDKEVIVSIYGVGYKLNSLVL